MTYHNRSSYLGLAQLPPHIHLLQFSSTDFLRGRLDSADWTRPDQVLVKELLTHYTRKRRRPASFVFIRVNPSYDPGRPAQTRPVELIQAGTGLLSGISILDSPGRSLYCDVSVQLPLNIADRVRYPSAVVDKVRELACNWPDSEIADRLNREGQTSAKGRPYTVKIIQWIRCRYRIPPAELKRRGELTVRQVAERFGTSDQVVYYWIDHSVIRSRRINPGMPHWITLSDRDEQKLREWVRKSRRIQPVS